MPKKPGFNLPPTYAESRRIWRNKQLKDTMQFEADLKEADIDQKKTDSLLRGFKTLEALNKFKRDNAEKLKLLKEQKRLERLKKSG